MSVPTSIHLSEPSCSSPQERHKYPQKPQIRDILITSWSPWDLLELDSDDKLNKLDLFIVV